ncbi:MAG: hypothetical protein LUG89_03585 [Methanosphaera sp.]|nr:hypothetical protein [Methanosphaera sp.]
MNDEQKKNLVKAVESTSPWERIPTTVEGVFIVKTPEHNNSQTVFVELNPSVQAQPIKKRGVYLKNLHEYEAFKKLVENPKVEELLSIVSEYYTRGDISRIEI